MQEPIACVTRAWGSFGRSSASQPSAWFWAWSWDPLKFTRRHPPHHLSPAWANGGIDGINPATDTLFKEGLVYEADVLGSSNKAQADFFLWKEAKFTEEQYRKWFGKRKPCIKGSDSHNVNDELGKLKDQNSQPTDKYGWIKPEPTFNGLRQIINEPEDRVYIGRIPPKLEARPDFFCRRR